MMVVHTSCFKLTVDMESMPLKILSRFFINLLNYIKLSTKGKGMSCKTIGCINLTQRQFSKHT